MYLSVVSWPGVDPRDVIPGERPTEVDRVYLRAGAGIELAGGLFQTGPRYRTTRSDGGPGWLLMLTAGGAGIHRHADRYARAEPHTVAVWLPHASQDYGTCTDAATWTFAYAHVAPRPLWTRVVSTWPQPLPGLAMLALDEATWGEAWAAMTRARRLLAGPQRGRAALAINALEAVVLWCDEANPAAGPLPDTRVRRAAELARQCADRPLAAEALADAAGLSPSRLTVLFRQQLGESPVSYAERLRLERAANLIASAGLSVKEAAAAAGYDDPYHFSRRFTRRLGRPPSQWHRTNEDR